MSDRSTQTTAAGAERGVRRRPKEHYISGMRPSSTRRSLLGALAFVCALVGSIAVHAEIISVPSAEVVSVPPVDPTNAAASHPLPTVVRGSPPSTAGVSVLARGGISVVSARRAECPITCSPSRA